MNENQTYIVFIMFLIIYLLVVSLILYIKPLMKYYKVTKDKEIITEFEYNSRTVRDLLTWILVIIIPVSLLRIDLLGGVIVTCAYLPQLFFIIFSNKIKFYEEGFFYQKKFIYWKEVEGIEIVNDKVIKIKVFRYTTIDILISQVENKNEFLQIFTENGVNKTKNQGWNFSRLIK